MQPAVQRRGPRVKGYRKTWVDEKAGILLDGPPSEADVAHCRLFDSKREAWRYLVLRKLQREGQIWDLQMQVRFPLNVVRPDGQIETVSHWRADFVYRASPPVPNGVDTVTV